MGAGRGSLGPSVSLRSATHDPPPSWVSHAPRARRGRGAAAARLGHQGLKRLLPLLALVLLPIALLLLALLRHRTHPLPTFASPVATLGVRVSSDRMRWVRQTPNPRVELVMRSSTHRCLAPVIPPTSVRSHRCRGQGRRTRQLRDRSLFGTSLTRVTDDLPSEADNSNSTNGGLQVAYTGAMTCSETCTRMPLRSRRFSAGVRVDVICWKCAVQPV